MSERLRVSKGTNGRGVHQKIVSRLSERKTARDDESPWECDRPHLARPRGVPLLGLSDVFVRVLALVAHARVDGDEPVACVLQLGDRVGHHLRRGRRCRAVVKYELRGGVLGSNLGSKERKPGGQCTITGKEEEDVEGGGDAPRRTWLSATRQTRPHRPQRCRIERE